MRIALLLTLTLGLVGCGASMHENYLGPRVALGQQLSIASALIYPAQLRANDKVDGRFIVTENSLIFDSQTNQKVSQRWLLTDIRAIHRPTPNELVLEPFAGSGYMLELPGQGLIDRDYRIVVGRLALAHRMR